jgi:hypothetical protein
MQMLRKVIRRAAIVAAILNGLFLAYVGLWTIPRRGTGTSLPDEALLIAALFLPIVGALWSVFRPRSGSLILLTSVGLYLIFCAVRALEQNLAGQAVGWDPHPLYTFAAPSALIALLILLTAKEARHSE